MKKVKSDTTFSLAPVYGNSSVANIMNPNELNDYELTQMMPVQHNLIQNPIGNNGLMIQQSSQHLANNKYGMNDLGISDNTMMPQPIYTMNNNYANNSYYSWSSNLAPTTQTNRSFSGLVHKPTHQAVVPTSGIEDTLEDSVKCSIKVIHQSYTMYLSSIVENMNEDLKRNSHFNNIQHNYSSYNSQAGNVIMMNSSGNFEEIMKYLGFYARKFVRFSQNIPGMFTF